MKKVYVHRAGHWYKMYMNNENEELLSSCVQVVCEGERETPMEEDELIQRMHGAEIVLSLNGYGAAEITNRVLERVGTVKLIVISHWWRQFSQQNLSSLGIEVIEGSTANAMSVAEWVLAAALMGIKRLPDFNKALKEGSPWAEPRWSPGMGMLFGKNVGLLGLGRVGRFAAKYFKAFGANVCVYDKFLPEKTYALHGVRKVELDELLATCDIVSLHLPVNDGTRRILTPQKLAIIKDGAVFINSARADLYDENDLVDELKKNRFLAYLDVYAQEPLSAESPLRTMGNCFITPHVAGHNYDMFYFCGKQAVETIRDYALGNH